MNVPAVNPARQPRRKVTALVVSAFQTLQFKASLMVVALCLGLIAFYMGTSLKIISAALLRNEIELSQQKAEHLAIAAAPCLAEGNTPRARAALEEAARRMIRASGTVYVAFIDPDGVTLASSLAPNELPSHLFSAPGELSLPAAVGDTTTMRRQGKNKSYLDIFQPIMGPSSSTNGQRSGRVLGGVRLVTDLFQAKAQVTAITERLYTFTAVILALVIPLSLLATHRIVAPLYELARAARALANGVMDARVPVRSRNEIGQLAQSFNMMASRVTQSQMELLQLAAELDARVQERTRELQELASRDALTGLYNRRYFGEVMAREFAAAERYQSDLTCLMFDLDHFKKINDRFGHSVGDDALILLADAIRAQLRSSDIAARFGGDEFILLLPRTSAHAARSLADRVQKQFIDAAREKYPDLPAGLSIGIASLRRTRSASAEALVNQADLALYEAKANGRGRMVEAPAVPDYKPPEHAMNLS